MYHLVATTTLLPGLKGAREYAGKPRPPQIVKSGHEALELFLHALNEIGLKQYKPNHLDIVLEGLPIAATSDWTYWIVQDKVN